MRTVLAAAVQATPVFLDREATVEKVCRLAKEAAAFGAELIVLPEAFVPGYPDWVWRSQPWKDARARYRRLLHHLASWGIVAAAPATQRGLLPSPRLMAADLHLIFLGTDMIGVVDRPGGEPQHLALELGE